MDEDGVDPARTRGKDRARTRAAAMRLSSRKCLKGRARAVERFDGDRTPFIGKITLADGDEDRHNPEDVTFLGQLASPTQVLEARLAIEPELARLAALHGLKADFESIRNCSERARAAVDWRSYEAWDNKLHQAIATATKNKLLIFLFDTLNVVRRSIVWGQERTTGRPPVLHESFDQHDAIVAAIEAHDPAAAADRMRDHLRSVRDPVLPSPK